MAWTEAADVVARWVGDDRPTDLDAVSVQIADAEAMIVAALPEVADRIDAEVLDVADVVRVVSRMVIRVLRNPHGFRQRTETTGPFAQSSTFAGNRPGELELTDADIADLGFDLPKRQGRAFSIITSKVPS